MRGAVLATSLAMVAAVLSVALPQGAAVAGPAPAFAGPRPALAGPSARAWPGHPDRRLVIHVVRRGDTASGLSVRYHAWTREFIALNGSRLYVGQRVRVPVVISAARKARKAKAKKSHKAQQVTSHSPKSTAPSRSKWRHYRLDRAQVRRVIVRQARWHGVPVNLALAVAWQESGWHQPLISTAGAIGVMQVLPSTGRWMSLRAGRQLNLYDTHGNVRAGTLLLQILRANTRTDRAAVAAYYEGLGGIQNGWYAETKRYVRSVMAVKRLLDRTGRPTR